ncbi:MAG: S-layer family protein [Spirulina sp. SIO3F2]|nr:S-layer family protein [Spirulina sp. SIO3F2]
MAKQYGAMGPLWQTLGGLLGGGILGGCAMGVMNGTALAQTVTADGTVGTMVTGAGPFMITGGTTQGGNLFHSFTEFSPSTATTEFAVGGTIERIFSRVTGSNASNLDGILRVTGGINPDFFLINPNGIVLGPNAQLDMSGSFIGSTASSIVFPNTLEFSANDTTVAPLLTINRPTGLILNTNAPTITVSSTTGLNIQPNKTLGLLGGGVTLTNATITAAQGRVELGGVLENDTVHLEQASDGWTFDYRNIGSFGDLRLASGSFIDLSGDGGGNLVMQGRDISLLDGSTVQAFVTGTQTGGNLEFNAANTMLLDNRSRIYAGGLSSGDGGEITITSNHLTFQNSSELYAFTVGTGQAPNTTLNVADRLLVDNGGGIYGGVFGSGNGGEITITSNRLTFQNSGELYTFTVGAGQAANVTINTTTHEQLNSAFVGSLNFADGDSGNVTVMAETMMLQGGSQLATGTIGDGAAGTLTVRANTSITAIGEDASGRFTSGFYVSTIPGSTGNAGVIDVETGSLSLQEGAQFFAGTFGDGNGGSIRVTADSAAISGLSPTFGFASSILTAASQATPITRGFGNGGLGGGSGSITLNINQIDVENGGVISASTSGVSDAGAVVINADTVRVAGRNTAFDTVSRISSASFNAGNAGFVVINTNSLTVEDEGEIAVSGTGTGNAGNIEVNARTIYLNNNGLIRAESAAGNQGNITLNASDILLLRNRGLISTDATGSATGGNITINAPVIAGYENSDITANAVLGAGGNINITTQGIFGLAFRDQLTPDNDITASSQFGVNGTITVNEFSLDPSSGLVALMAALSDASDQVNATCAAAGNSEFIATGKGGISPTPDAQNGGIVGPWQDNRDLSAFLSTTVAPPSTIAASTPTIQEATGFQQLSNGQIALVAEPDITHSRSHYATCALGGADSVIGKG